MAINDKGIQIWVICVRPPNTTASPLMRKLYALVVHGDARSGISTRDDAINAAVVVAKSAV
jgi:hypothetical protein